MIVTDREDLLINETVVVENTGEQLDITELMRASYSSAGLMQVSAHSRQPRPPCTLNGFFTLVKEAMDHKATTESIDLGNIPILTEEYPLLDVKTEVLSYSLARRLPATQGGPPFAGKRTEYKPRIRNIVNDPEDPNYKVFIFGQEFENEIVFTCWAKTNKVANARVMWLEDLFVEYRWFFRYNGVKNIIFLGRGADIIIPQEGDNVLCGRPISIYLRTEKLTTISEPIIKRILVRYTIDSED